MNKYTNWCLLIVIALLAPSLAKAQLYSDYELFSDHNWHHTPDITITGPPDIIFPVQGAVNFSDDFGDERSGGRLHEGNDLMAPKMTPIMAARGGRITYAATTEPSYGYMISIAGDDGYKYNYLHINNDTPGTDDGQGGIEYAYAPGISQGITVVQGQTIAWVGDSGNAEATPSHLHFEIRLADDTAINPYQYLNEALDIYTYSISAVEAASPTINFDKGLTSSSELSPNCEAGTLIRTPENSSVYYCGADGKRYVFPNAKTYATWYSDFSDVKNISLEEMSKIMLGGNVTYKPGVRLVKIQTDPHVYAVDLNGTLRLMITPAIAEKYYGINWNKNVEDIPDAFFTNYKIGNSVTN
ncbi:MAG TPA: M23 family metallopeptidase [Patescibacteria group bacterium]|nr:M23 family metallopeptidase [Patescibacteria group bacterium]